MHAPVITPMLTSLPGNFGSKPGRRFWTELTADVPVGIDGRVYRVSRGYEYDGSSIPSLFGLLWWLIGTPMQWPFSYAGAWHDAAYTDDLYWVSPSGYAESCYFNPVDAHAIYAAIIRTCLLARAQTRWQRFRAHLTAHRCWLGVAGYGAVWGNKHGYVSWETYCERHRNPRMYVRSQS